MKIFIATENSICRVGERLFLSNAFCKVIERYYSFFGQIVLCTRVEEEDSIPSSGAYSEGTKYINDVVKIDSLKSFVLGKHNDALEERLKECDLVIARVPSVVANKAAKLSRKHKIPYMVEVIGCTWDSYWNYSLFGKVVAPIAFLEMRRTVKKASYATYVTEIFLQKRYPSNCKSINCSNVFIEKCEKQVLDNRIYSIEHRIDDEVITLMTAAAVDVVYKGQEYVIKSIPILNQRGIKVLYKLAGFGDTHRLAQIAEECGVKEQVVFLGSLSHDAILSEEDNIDIYIQPSLQEGLPRSVIEAMSRACPVLGARTAGIPELIPSDCVFARKSYKDIADKVQMLLSSDMKEYAKMNFEKAKEYTQDILEKRRTDYYTRIIMEISPIDVENIIDVGSEQ